MLPLIEVPLTLSEMTGPGPAISAITPEDADLTRNAGTGGEACDHQDAADELDEGRNIAQKVWQAAARHCGHEARDVHELAPPAYDEGQTE